MFQSIPLHLLIIWTIFNSFHTKIQLFLNFCRNIIPHVSHLYYARVQVLYISYHSYRSVTVACYPIRVVRVARHGLQYSSNGREDKLRNDLNYPFTSGLLGRIWWSLLTFWHCLYVHPRFWGHRVSDEALRPRIWRFFLIFEKPLCIL